MRLLLFSDSRSVFEKTNEIIQSKFELMWYKYVDLQKGQYPVADVVIIHFDKVRIQDVTIPIIRIKGRLGTHVSILVIMRGTPQEIYSVLTVGADDYITNLDDMQEYKQKLEDILHCVVKRMPHVELPCNIWGRNHNRERFPAAVNFRVKIFFVHPLLIYSVLQTMRVICLCQFLSHNQSPSYKRVINLSFPRPCAIEQERLSLLARRAPVSSC